MDMSPAGKYSASSILPATGESYYEKIPNINIILGYVKYPLLIFASMIYSMSKVTLKVQFKLRVTFSQKLGQN